MTFRADHRCWDCGATISPATAKQTCGVCLKCAEAEDSIYIPLAMIASLIAVWWYPLGFLRWYWKIPLSVVALGLSYGLVRPFDRWIIKRAQRERARNGTIHADRKSDPPVVVDGQGFFFPEYCCKATENVFLDRECVRCGHTWEEKYTITACGYAKEGGLGVDVTEADPATAVANYHSDRREKIRDVVKNATKNAICPECRHTADGSARNSELASYSLVFGILGLGLFILPFVSLSAVLCGHIAVVKIKRDRGLTGKGKAIAGLLLGYAGLAHAIYFFANFW